MTIKREDLENIDFSDVDTGEAIPLSTPGDFLKHEFLDALNVSAYRLSADIGVPRNRISEIIHGRRAITADTALRFSRFFGTTPQFWMNLQQDYDLRVTAIDIDLSNVKIYAA